jgi:regulator of sigma E protease
MQNLQYIFQNFHWFILFIGALVFFHELGHFLVAKACQVKVLRFSFGFGPKLFGFVRGETEYRVSALPLGGYVKMLGDVPGVEIAAEDEARAFSNRPLWQRAAVVVAGPACNFALAFAIYWAIGLGTQTFSDTRLGIVRQGKPAWEAGVRPGDKLVAIDRVPVKDWEDLRKRIATQPGVELVFTVERDGTERDLTVIPRAAQVKNLFQDVETRGRVGISPYYVKPIVGVIDRESPAGRAGVMTGDQVTAVNGVAVSSWHELRASVDATVAGNPVHLQVQRGEAELTFQLEPGPRPDNLDPTLFSAADTRTGYTGLVSKESLVAKVEADTPAERIGLEPNDRLLRLAIAKGDTHVEEPIGVWAIDLAAFQGVDARSTFLLTYQRGREVLSSELQLTETVEKDEFKNELKRMVFGAFNDHENTLGVYTFERAVGPMEAAATAARNLGVASEAIVTGLWKLVNREVPADSVGGPMMLFVIAAESAERGLRPYMGMMALVSVMLGLMNLLPVPVLDGGHLVMFAIEAIRRRPPSVRFREVANLVGLVLLLSLMVFAFRNDIVRFVLPDG